MPRRALQVCSQPGCPQLCEGGRCADHRREADRARGTASQRGYGHAHREGFRKAVLRREPSCRLCGQPATVADHWPVDRRELVRQGLDANDPARGRGLCTPCHGKATQANPDQQGGWNAR